MDNTTEAMLLKRLEEYLNGQTVILVSHRASMLSLVDRLLVIDRGHIIADGQKQLIIDAMKAGTLGIRN